MKNLLLLCLFLCIQSIVFAQTPSDTLTAQLTEIAQNSEIPGFAVALVSKDKVLYKKGFGYADKASQRPFEATTVQNIGSITKTLIAVALMQLVEKEKIGLDDDINRYLPFKVVNPYFLDEPITIRQLATHTSSLTDGKNDMTIEYAYLFHGDVNYKASQLPKSYPRYFRYYQTNQRVSMEQFFKNTYLSDGEWYSKHNFLKKKPGTTYRYTNIGATLLAYIIEEISGQSFSEYTQEHIFKPLGMKNSYWSWDDVEAEKAITHYLENGLAIPKYELITYPDGGLITDVSDFSLYLIDMIRGLNGEGQLMQDTFYRQMMSNQLIEDYFPEGDFEKSKGLMWTVNPTGDNIGANGADPGVATYTLFTTAGNVGMIIFLNSTIYDHKGMEADFKSIRATLFQNIGKLMKK